MPKSSISRKKSGGKSKRIKAGSTKATFPGSNPHRTSRTLSPGDDVLASPDREPTKPPPNLQYLEQKSRANKLNYLRRKNSTVALKVDELGSQVSAGVKREAVLVKHVEKQAKIAKKADESSAKIMSTLTSTRRKLGLSSRLRAEEKSKATSVAKTVATQQQYILSTRELAHKKELKKADKNHVTVLRREMSKTYKASRDDAKLVVELEDQFKALERDRDELMVNVEERISSELQSKEDEMNCKAKVSTNVLKSNLKSHYKLQQKDMLKTQRDLKKTVTGLERKLESAEEVQKIAEVQRVLSEKTVQFKVKEAVSVAKTKERLHYSSVLAKERVKVQSLKKKVDCSKSVMTKLVNAKVSPNNMQSNLLTWFVNLLTCYFCLHPLL